MQTEFNGVSAVLDDTRILAEDFFLTVTLKDGTVLKAKVETGGDTHDMTFEDLAGKPVDLEGEVYDDVQEAIEATIYQVGDGSAAPGEIDRGLSPLEKELLEALRRCVSALAANGAPNCEAVKEARAAIAKAERRGA